MPKHTILLGNAVECLRTIPPNSIHMAVTSPPYFGPRDYFTTLVKWTDGWIGELGREPDPRMYVDHLLEVFDEVKRVLRPDGTFWLNIGDVYNGSGGSGGDYNKGGIRDGQPKVGPIKIPWLKEKDMIGIPWMVAFAMRDRSGWYLRSDTIWCLSGGTCLYVKTKQGITLVSVKDLGRCGGSHDSQYPRWVDSQLWNGAKWTNIVGVGKQPRPKDPVEIELRSGQRIECTKEHVFPTRRGLVKTSDLVVGDTLVSCNLPDEVEYLPNLPADDIGWFIGIYLAEGSHGKGGRVIQISTHRNENLIFEKLCAIAAAYHGTCRKHNVEGNRATVNLHGSILNGIINTYIEGNDAKTKHLKNVCWRRSNKFLEAVLNGYLDGDDHYEPGNNRWRLGFTRNYSLERDLRTICARLGYTITLKPSISKIGDDIYPSLKGEIRKERSGHHNEMDRNEIIDIRRGRGRYFWNIEVADSPHIFALSSGILTHNSKTNPPPESPTDRPVKSHEYIFEFAKSPKYYYDRYAVLEPLAQPNVKGPKFGGTKFPGKVKATYSGHEYDASKLAGRNKRDVWTFSTAGGFRGGSHLAVFPPYLAETCIRAGTSAHGCCSVCGKPYKRVVEMGEVDEEWARLCGADSKGEYKGKNTKDYAGKLSQTPGDIKRNVLKSLRPKFTTEWKKMCKCDGSVVVPCTVLDPFLGSGTTTKVAMALGRSSVGTELNTSYINDMKLRIGIDIENHPDFEIIYCGEE